MPVTLAVLRFDPGSDSEPYWGRYRVEVRSNQTVLDALLAVEESLDPTLAFRRTCRSGICGACGAVINGRLRLLCHTLISTATAERAQADADIAIRPLPRFKVLKDLVVDLDPFLDALKRLNAWLVPDPDYDGTMPPDVFQRLWSAATCILCGICAADSTAREASMQAAAAVRALRFLHDPRDRVGAARQERLDALGILNSGFAERLRATCPKAVDITGLLQAPPGLAARGALGPAPESPAG